MDNRITAQEARELRKKENIRINWIYDKIRANIKYGSIVGDVQSDDWDFIEKTLKEDGYVIIYSDSIVIP